MKLKNSFKTIYSIVFLLNLIVLQSVSRACEPHEDQDNKTHQFSSLACFENIPFELQHKVSVSLEDIKDVVAFGSTSSKNQKFAEVIFEERAKVSSWVTGSLPEGREWKISYFMRHLMAYIISPETVFSVENEHFYLKFAKACQNLELPLEHFVRHKLWNNNLRYESYNSSKLESYGLFSPALKSISKCFFQFASEVKDIIVYEDPLKEFYEKLTIGLNNKDTFSHEIALELLINNLYCKKDNFQRYYTLGLNSTNSKNTYSFSLKEYNLETFQTDIYADIVHIFKFLIDNHLSELPLFYLNEKFQVNDILELSYPFMGDKNYHSNSILYFSIAQKKLNNLQPLKDSIE